MIAKRLRKGESPIDKIAQIEKSMKVWRTKLVRASNAIAALEKRRTYYTKKVVELGRP